MVSARAIILCLFLATTLVSVLGNPVPKGSSRVRRHGPGGDCSKCKWENDDYWEQEEEDQEEEEDDDSDECGDDHDHSKPSDHHGPEKIGGHPLGGNPTYGSHPASPFDSGHGQGSPETAKHPGGYLDHPPTHGNGDSGHVKGKPPHPPSSWPHPSYSPPSYGPKPWKTEPTPAVESDQATRTTAWQNFAPTASSPNSYHPPAVVTSGALDTVTPTHSWSWPNAHGKGDHSGAIPVGQPQHHPDSWDHKPSPSSSHGCVEGNYAGGAGCNQVTGKQGGNRPVTKQAAPTPIDAQTGSAPLNGPEKVQGTPYDCAKGGNCGSAHSTPFPSNSPNQGSTTPLSHPTGRSDIPVELKTQPFPGTSTNFPSQARDRPSSGVPSPTDAWNKPAGRPPGPTQIPKQFSSPKDQNPHQPKYGEMDTQQTLTPTFGSSSGIPGSTPNYPSANNCEGNSQSGGNCRGSGPHSPVSTKHPYPIDPRGDIPSTGDGSGCGSSSGKSACDGSHGGVPLTKNGAPLPTTAGTPAVPPYPAQSGQQPPVYQPQPQSELHPQQQPQPQSQPQPYPQPQSHPQQPQSQPRPQPHPQSYPQQQPESQPRPQPHPQPYPQQQPQSVGEPYPQSQPQSQSSTGTHGCTQGSCPPSTPDSTTGCSASGCNGHGDINNPPYVDKISPLSDADSMQTPYKSNPGNPFLNGMISHLSPASDNHMGMSPTDLGVPGAGGPGMLGKGNPFLDGTIRVQPGQPSWSNPTAPGNRKGSPSQPGQPSWSNPTPQDYGKGSPSQPGQPKWDNPTAPGSGKGSPLQPGQPSWNNPTAQDYGKGSPSQPGQPKWDNPTAPGNGKEFPSYPGQTSKSIGKGNPFLGSGQGKPSYSPDATGSHDPNGYTKNANSPNPWSGSPSYGNHASTVPNQNGNGFSGAAAGAFASAGAFAGSFGSPMNGFGGPQHQFPHGGDKSPFGPGGMPVSPYGSYDPYDPQAYPCDDDQQKESPYSGVKGKFGPWASGVASAYSSASASSWTG